MGQIDPEELVRRGQAGEPEAFDALVDLYYDVTFRLASRMLGDPDEAQDAVQEIFVKAWSSLPGFRRTSRFSTWLHSIAVRHCLSISRQRSRQAARRQSWFQALRAGDSVASGGSASPEGDWETRFVVWDAVSRLPEKFRVVVTLHYFAQFNAQEIADELSIPINTVYSRLRIAADRLATALKSLEE